MKKKSIVWIVIPVAVILICGICVTAFLLVSGQKKTDRYYEQMRSAKSYLTEGNYEKVVAAYRAAIDLKPENPEPYIALAQVYMYNEQYVEAAEVATQGITATKDLRLEDLLASINEKRYARSGDGNSLVMMAVPEIAAEDGIVAEGTDSPNLTLRSGNLDILTDFCYQEYVDEYGDATVTYVSAEDGYLAKFKSLNASVYFRNDAQHKKIVNETTRRPEKNTRPYRVDITPSLLFVGYEGYVSYERLCALFKTTVAAEYDNELGIYCIRFDYNGCRLIIETDSAGNMYQDNPLIQLWPYELVKASWVEPVEESETEEETFVLGSHRYTYDVASIEIYNETIEDLSPLYECKNLRELILGNCKLGSLDPLYGCSALVGLSLNGSTGFSDLSPLAGLSALEYVVIHGCTDVTDISPIMGLSLRMLDTCFSGISYEQALEYKQRHPECEVWFDNTLVEE